ncbi:MAG: hypothetical protein ACXWXJ_12305 [Aeromicrobium sp.]
MLVALVVMAVALLAASITARLGEAVTERTRARTAADAAALAAVLDGRQGADSVARANDAVVEGYRTAGSAVEVTVRVGRTRATSRAAPSPPSSPSTLLRSHRDVHSSGRVAVETATSAESSRAEGFP